MKRNQEPQVSDFSLCKVLDVLQAISSTRVQTMENVEALLLFTFMIGNTESFPLNQTKTADAMKHYCIFWPTRP